MHTHPPMQNKMASRESNAVAGEGSESDDEYEINQSYFMKNTMVAKEETTGQRRGIVVEGEASESDEDEAVCEVAVVAVDGDHDDDAVAELQLGGEKQGGKGSPEHQSRRKVKFHYDSFFHRRLRVSNLELRSDVVQNTTNMYKEANTKLQSSVFYLNRSQASVQDVFSNMALISGDLQSLTSSFDRILSRDFLPTLNMKNIAKSGKPEPIKT